jgi:Mn2+/Fe2+ NRAMP family transporter
MSKHPAWSTVIHQIVVPSKPHSETLASYLYVGVALFGSAISPYELFFYSSGAVEERWQREDLVSNRISAYAGFVVGALLSITAIGVAALIFQPRHISVHDLATITLGPAFVLGKLGVAAFLIGLFVTTFGATLEVTLANGYIVSQYFGWPWGKLLRPKQASRFNLVMIVSLLLGGLILVSSLDPIAITDIAMVFAAVALPITYFPILVVANDHEYMDGKGNGKILNLFASVFLVIITIIALAAIPLMIWTKLGT